MTLTVEDIIVLGMEAVRKDIGIMMTDGFL